MSRIIWKRNPNNPVILPGQINGELDENAVSGSHIIRVEDHYRMYYWGRSRNGINRICIAESPVNRVNEWIGMGAVLGPQKNTEYNFNGPVCPMVLPRDDGPWLMYMGTTPKGTITPGFMTWYSGAAISHDEGITWEYATNEPLLPTDRPYDCAGTGTLFVFREGKEYRMYYTAFAPYKKRPIECVSEIFNSDFIPIVGIGYAISEDGLHWEKPFDHFLIPPRYGSIIPYENWIARPMILHEEGGGYRMWLSVTGVRYRICSLTSSDGIHWDWVPCNVAEGELNTGDPGSFDDMQCSYAGIVKEGSEYRMWYTGNGWGATGIGYAIGIAEE